LGLFGITTSISAQTCTITLEGKILDAATGVPLPFTIVNLEETGQICTANDSGEFVLKSICPGSYHLRLSHIGCDPEKQYIQLLSDTVLTIYMKHHVELLTEIVIRGRRINNASSTSHSVNRAEIAEESNKNFADVLEKIQGVSVLRNGSGVSKPMVHGLYGNRLTILNNGIVQSGQQWGNDHAPEIDAFVADNITVIKGAASLAYPGTQMGAIILVEPGSIAKEPHLHGEINSITQSNGRGQTTNLRLEQYGKAIAWRASGTFKYMGDRKSPDYYLTNTGQREASGALQLEKKISTSWIAHAYYSYFQTQLGLLRGSHIGNITDLENAFSRETPFFTNDHFSYTLDEPRQKVIHHLLKAETKYFLSFTKSLQFKYAYQRNQREEFDIRRGERSDIPALSLGQGSHFAEAFFKKSDDENNGYKLGVQYTYTDNTNNPETGVLPLIPDYYSYQSSAFAILQKAFKKWNYEGGIRYDRKDLFVWSISKTLPREIIKKEHHFENISASAGATYSPFRKFKLTYGVGYTKRAPEINELYSTGLHQGVSGIEEGDANLSHEQSLKLTLSSDWQIKSKLFVQLLGYYHSIGNFIYLEPQEELRLTIRGAFPVFLYKQTDAMIAGSDFLLSYEPISKIRLVLKASWLRGQNKSQNIPLVLMPAPRAQTSFTYMLSDLKGFRSNNLTIHGKYVARQNHLLENQDFLPAPAHYFLFGFNVSTSLSFEHSTLKISLSGENLLNKKYRDYLNRLRYFSDDAGANLALRIGWIF
jgi:iron complex outermembrane receptor protein